MMNCMRYEWDMHDLSHGGPQTTARVELVIFDKGNAIVKFVAPQLFVKKTHMLLGMPKHIGFQHKGYGI